jgi:hypothetical protein
MVFRRLFGLISWSFLPFDSKVGTGWFCRPNALALEALAAAPSCLAETRKSRGRAGRIHRTIQVAPLALDPDVGSSTRNSGQENHIRFKLAPLGTDRKSMGRASSEHLSSQLIRSSLQSCNTTGAGPILLHRLILCMFGIEV